MTDQALTFNWHELGEYDEPGFLKWMLVNLVSESHTGETRAELDNLVTRVGEASDDFDHVVMTIQLNGIEVNVEHFLRGLFHNLQLSTQRYVWEQLRALPDLDELETAVGTFRRAVLAKARRVADNLGIQLTEEDEV